MHSSHIEKIILKTLALIAGNAIVVLGLLLYISHVAKLSSHHNVEFSNRLKELDQNIKNIQKVSDGYFSFITGAAQGLDTYNQIKKDITTAKKALKVLAKNINEDNRELVKQMDLKFYKLTEIGEKMAIAKISEEEESFAKERTTYLELSKELDDITSKIFNIVTNNIAKNSHKLEKDANKQLMVTYAFIILSIIFLLTTVRYLIIKVKKVLQEQADELIKEKATLEENLSKIVNELAKNYESLQSSVLELDESSSKLSTSSSQQAAATEEAVAAMEEISSMVKQTNENGEHALEIANAAQKKVNEGQEVVQKLSQAMEEIHKSNNELSVIVNLINEITEKTKIINSIVVKTELLSFNASIEAARAAEYGKGFAVVAEEVGNLARLSGDSAKEIEYLLGESVLKVNEIVELIQSRVNHGQKRSQECVEVFKDINDLNNNLTRSVNSISTATNEQTKGVEQTTKAMNDISKATQENLKVTQGTSQLSSAIKQEIERLNSSMVNLQKILLESKKKSNEINKTNNETKQQEKNRKKQNKTDTAIGEIDEKDFDPEELAARYNQSINTTSQSPEQFDDSQFE